MRQDKLIKNIRTKVRFLEEDLKKLEDSLKRDSEEDKK
jgi:hypothetical protein